MKIANDFIDLIFRNIVICKKKYITSNTQS